MEAEMMPWMAPAGAEELQGFEAHGPPDIQDSSYSCPLSPFSAGKVESCSKAVFLRAKPCKVRAKTGE